MHIKAKITALVQNKREIEAICPQGVTYKVRVPHYKLQDNFFKVGDVIPLKIVELDQFALYDV